MPDFRSLQTEFELKSGRNRHNLVKKYGQDFRSLKITMPRRKMPLVASKYYHLYNRGNNHQKVFFNRDNYLFFLQQIRHYLLGESGKNTTALERFTPPVSIIAYCLMPNHYHLLLQPHDDDLSHKMQLFGISYTKSINKQQNRVGSLFQGQFQAVLVNQNDYLLHLSRYIHLNPVKAGLVKRAEDWEFSSYREYIGLRRGTLPNPAIILEQFHNQGSYQQFVVSDISTDLIAHLLIDNN